MKQSTFICCALAAIGFSVGAAAGAIDDIQAAAGRLASAPNYSWKTVTSLKESVVTSQRSPIEGQAERDGFTYFRFELDGNPVEAILRGQKAAIRTETDWEADNELLGDREWIARRLLAFKAPAAEILDLLAITSDLKKSWLGVYSGNLTPNGVRALLGERSRDNTISSVAPGALGTVKFWVKKGELTKYEFQVRGVVVLQDHGQQFAIDRTTSVEISNVGSTRVVVPDAAKRKLGE